MVSLMRETVDGALRWLKLQLQAIGFSATLRRRGKLNSDFMQFMLSVQSTPDPASPPGSRSVPGHDQATPVLKRLNSPVSIFDALDESPPRVPPKTIREFRRKWSFGGGHSGGVRRLLRLSEREEPGKAGMLTTSSPVRPAQQSKTERAASTLCAAARGRSVRRELALVHATATYLQARDRFDSPGIPPTEHPPRKPRARSQHPCSTRAPDPPRSHPAHLPSTHAEPPVYPSPHP